MSVKLSFSFGQDSTNLHGDGLQLDNPLFRILAAIHARGSIGAAAEAVELSYRHVWGCLKDQEIVFGGPLVESSPGKPARLSALGERLLWAERRATARLQPAAEAMAARLDTEILLAARPALRRLPMVASHDLLIAQLRDALRQNADYLLDAEFAGSTQALEQLNAGTCPLAGIHLPLRDEHLCQRGSPLHQGMGRLLRLGDHKLIRMASREQGLIVAPGNPMGIRDLADIAARGLSFINRQPGSGTRLLVEALLDHQALPAAAIRGFEQIETTHLAIAAAVAAGLADAGFGLRAAAEPCGLGFVPLATEDYFIVCHKAFLDTPAMEALRATLATPAFRALADSLPGYSGAGAGEVISLRRTLPWYK